MKLDKLKELSEALGKPIEKITCEKSSLLNRDESVVHGLYFGYDSELLTTDAERLVASWNHFDALIKLAAAASQGLLDDAILNRMNTQPHWCALAEALKELEEIE